MEPAELKAWRSKNGYSQQKLAKVLGLNTLTISLWERGVRKRIPSFLSLALKNIEKEQREEALRISETNFRSLFFELANDAIFILDPETGNILEVNQKMCDLFGFKRDKVLGLNLNDLISAKYTPKVKDNKHLLKKVNKKGAQLFEWLVKKKSGRLFWVEVNLKHAIIGGKNYILAILRDITERKHIEERIKESEARYRALFESCPDGIVIADIETKRLQYANPAMSKMLGYKEEELKRMGVSDIHPEDKLEHIISEFGSQARGEKTLAIDIPLLNKNRRVIYADVNSKPVLLDGKKNIIGFFRNITQRKRADDEIKNKTEQLKKLYELSKKIGSIISTDGLLPWIAENAAVLLNIDTCSYRIKEGDYLIRCGGFGRGIEMMRKEKLKIGESLTGIVARDKKPLVVRNMQDDPRLINEHKNIVKRLGLISFLGVPMMVEGEVRGVLCVSSKKYRRFTKSDIEFLSSFGEIAAIALENAKLFGEKTKWSSQFKALCGANKKIASQLNMDELLSSITEHANKLLGTDGCNLRLRKGNELILSYGTKDTINLMLKKRLKIGESLAGTIAKTKKPLIVEDLRNEKRYIKKHREAAKNFGFVSFFGVPMLIEDEVIGVICGYTKKPKRFIETEIELLSSFADQAAIAVRNAKILKKFKKQIE